MKTDNTIENQSYARSLIEASLDPLVTISPEGKITDVNEASIKVTGIVREKLIGTDFSNYFTEPEKAKEGYKQLFEKGFVSDYPLTILHKNGKLTDVLYNATVYKDEQNNVLGVFAAARDITAQKQSLQYARSLIEASLDPLVTISPEGKIADVNEASINVTGVPREKLIGTDFSDYFTEPEKAKAGYKQVFEKGFVSDYPLTIRHKNGKLTDVLYNATVYKGEENNVLGVFAAARDITAQKQSSQYARSLIEASLDPLVTISPEGKITDVNEASVKATGVLREDLIGADFSNYFTEPEKARQGYKQVFEKGFVSDYPLTIRHLDGTVTPVLYNASVYKNDKGNVLGVFAAARDITKQKEAEDKSRKYAMLESKNKEMEQFVYVASHDLREPLLTIKNYIDLLIEDYGDGLDKGAEKYTGSISRAANRMDELIAGLLDYSRLSKAKQIEDVDCNEIVKAVLADLSLLITSNGAAINVDKLPIVKAYPLELRLLFQNLINNAVKFRKKDMFPEIHISSHKINNGWQFEIKDNGIGIEEKDKNKIFTIFQRLHNRNEYPGTGIGLAHCKKITESHNGTIWVESRPGHSSSFYFTILTENL